MEDIFEKTMIFMKSVKEICKESDTQYNFKCPLCEGQATAGKAGTNGHIHARCNKCNFQIMQ